jgi:hypothetical protein
MRAKIQRLSLLSLVAFASLGMAQVPAVTSFTGATVFGSINSTAQTIGFSFTANSSVTVSALGFYRESAAAYAEAVRVNPYCWNNHNLLGVFEAG